MKGKSIDISLALPGSACEYVELKELLMLSERQLQAEIVEPLLGILGFRNVHDTSGPSEHGKDLIATLDELGHHNLWAIQIKKFSPSAKVSSSTSFGALLEQLRQAIQEPVLDPLSGLHRPPDRCLFITPFPIPPRVRDAFHERLNERIFSILRIWDGKKLCDLLRDRMPKAIMRFSMEAQYRLSTAKYSDTITESDVAFGRKELELSSIYVDLSLTHSSNLLYTLASLTDLDVPELQSPRRKGDRLVVTCPRKVALAFKSTFEHWTASKLKDHNDRPVKRRSAKQLSINTRPFLQAVKQRINDVFADLSTMISEEATIEQRGRIARAAINVERDVRVLLQDVFVQYFCPGLKSAQSGSGKLPDRVPIPSSSLMKIPSCLYVLGPPGTGKTTLLRRIAHFTANNSKSLPVFLPLIRVQSATRHGLLEAIVYELRDHGLQVTAKGTKRNSIDSLLKSGQLRLCLDGLDETGTKAHALLREITKLAIKYPLSQIILSCRDSFAHTYRGGDLTSWDQALTFRLLPFNQEQLELFVAKWFSAEPSARRDLTKWLRQNQTMRSAATTPLVAALLCSLFEVGADLPTTELELFQRRLELLLGRWDRAKGIRVLRPDVRNRYEYLLKRLAFQLHSRERRACFSRVARELCHSCFVNYRSYAGPDAILQDCIQRGLLDQNEMAEVSFGHLTFQEYLCAEWLSFENPLQFIIGVLCKPWWEKTLEFYASRKQDISPLIDYFLSGRTSKKKAAHLHELAKPAPLTSREHTLHLGEMASD